MIVQKFLTYLRAERRYSEHSVRSYARDIEELTEFLLPRTANGGADSGSVSGSGEEIDFARITPDDFRAWIVWLSDRKKNSPSSINRKLSTMRSLYRWLRKEGCVEHDPFLRIGQLKTPKSLPVFVPESKMQRVVESLQDGTPDENGFIAARNRLIILLFYTTGIRLAELIGIDTRDFRSGYGELKIRGKGDRERIVPILDPVRRQIRCYLQEIYAENICNRDGKALFLTEKGERIGRSEVSRVVRETLGEAGIRGKRSPHVLRHTFATHLLNSGADIREIQELLGHASLRTTQIYTHNSITQLKEAYRHAHPRSKKR